MASTVAFGIAEPVDLELVFAADDSGSIDDDKLMLQRQGYADALPEPRVLQTVTTGRSGKITVSYIEWSDARPTGHGHNVTGIGIMARKAQYAEYDHLWE